MISIVIPLYNKEQYIGACLNSVLSQTYKDFELIVVNDGSSDNSVDIVNMIRDERVQLLSKNNGGPASARNLGVKEAKGEWVVFLDADDIFLPFALEYFIELISKHPGYSYYCCNYMLKTNNEIIKQGIILLDDKNYSRGWSWSSNCGTLKEYAAREVWRIEGMC